MNDFTRLMHDPAHIKREREAREETERQQHERRVRRGSHEPNDVKPSAADLRESIASDRTHNFENGVAQQTRHSPSKRNGR